MCNAINHTKLCVVEALHTYINGKEFDNKTDRINDRGENTLKQKQIEKYS
jgi:hypothetical protein